MIRVNVALVALLQRDAAGRPAPDVIEYADADGYDALPDDALEILKGDQTIATWRTGTWDRVERVDQ